MSHLKLAMRYVCVSQVVPFAKALDQVAMRILKRVLSVGEVKHVVTIEVNLL